jgi:hypothetical protein
MNLFNIVMGICLLSDPNSCREHRIQFESYESLNECILDAQFYIAQWQAANPGWKLGPWHCEYGDQPDNSKNNG